MIHKMQDIFPDPRERNLVASVARYHRRSFPCKNHKHYGMLTKSDRKMVDRLSAILRIADGLDWDHVDNVRKVFCETKGTDITISCFSDSPSTEEKEKISNKSALFEKVFKRKVGVKWYQA
jgi:exopolyphosphatase/guanosine-5'-triphosphate,3'-diphosphate pyrophosphatase